MPHHIPQENSEYPSRLGVRRPWFVHSDGIVAEIRQVECFEQSAAVCMRIRPHAPITLGSEFGKLWEKCASGVKQLFGLVAVHPLFEQGDMLRRVHGFNGDLMRAPGALGLFAIDELRSGPALRRAQDDHRPGRPRLIAARSRLRLDLFDLAQYGVQRLRHQLMHQRRVIPDDEMRLVTVSMEQAGQLFLWDTGQNRRVRDLVAVEVQDRQHRAIALRIQKLVGVPAGRQWPGLGLAVADDAADEQVRVIKGRSERMRQRVTQLAAFMDRAGSLRRGVAGDAAGERKLPKQPLHTRGVLRDARIDLAVGAFKVGVCHQSRPAVPWPGDINHIEIVTLDDPVKVRVDEVQARSRSPVPEQARLDMLPLQRLAQERVVQQVNLSDGEIVGRTPVGIGFSQFVRIKWSRHKGVRTLFPEVRG